MNKLIMTVFILLIPSMLFAQTFLDEDFSGSFPPSGWTVDSHNANWHSIDGNEAGGSAPEAVFNCDPEFYGTSRFISPEVDLTGVINLKVEFKYMVDHYSGEYTIGVATRSGGGNWNNVWQITNPTESIPATTEVVNIDNGDVGAIDFQICWFSSGDFGGFSYWYLDDFKLFQQLDHDMRVKNIIINGQYEPGTVITPTVVVENFGLSTETFDVNCDINIGEQNDYSELLTSITLEPGAEETLEFPSYTASTENELFEIVGTTILDGDMDESNDSMAGYFNTYTTERDMVVLEIGTGTWCGNCPGATMGADDLIENGHDVAVIEYHYEDNYQNNYGSYRITYYGMSGLPTAVFDGVDKFVGGSNNQSMYSYYLPIYQDRRVINSAFDIEIFGTNDGNDYTLNIAVNKMATIPWDNMVLHVALTESEIPENWQGQNELNFVERLMTPDAYGTDLDFSSSDNLDIELNFAFNNSWEFAHCELVAFIQNLDDKEILQGTKKALPDLTPLAADDDIVKLPMATELKGNYPNPFNPSTTISFALSEVGYVSLDVYNVMGQKVRTLVDGQIDAGEHTIDWDSRDDNGSTVSSGAYFYKLNSADYSSIKKMLLIK